MICSPSRIIHRFWDPSAATRSSIIVSLSKLTGSATTQSSKGCATEPLFRLHGDSPGFGGRALGHLNGQYAVAEFSRDGGGIHGNGQRNHPRELPETALLPMPDCVFDRRHIALALDRELVASGDEDLQVFHLQTS